MLCNRLLQMQQLKTASIDYLTVSMVQESCRGLHSWVLCSVSQNRNHGIGQTVLLSGAWSPLPDSHGCWQNSDSCGCRTEDVGFLLAILLAQLPAASPCHTALFIGSLLQGSLLLQGQQENLPLQSANTDSYKM